MQQTDKIFHFQVRHARLCISDQVSIKRRFLHPSQPRLQEGMSSSVLQSLSKSECWQVNSGRDCGIARPAGSRGRSDNDARVQSGRRKRDSQRASCALKKEGFPSFVDGIDGSVVPHIAKRVNWANLLRDCIPVLW